jgi:amphi-Trp domain-containing protein
MSGGDTSEETIYKSKRSRSRNAIASYLHRVANALDGGGTVPVDTDTTITVDPPAEPELEVDVERGNDDISLEFEIEWPEEDGGVDTEAAKSGATFELYEDKAGEWRWRLRHVNGNIIADSGEGYTAKANAEKGIESVKRNAPGAFVEQQE